MSATAKLLDPQLGLAAQQETLTTEALMTSAIEGEKLDPASLRSSIARRLGLPTAGLPAPSRSVEGLVDMLIDATQGYEHPLTLNSANFDSLKQETAEHLRDQAAACRRLAATARTRAGTSSLIALADHFDNRARQIDPFSVRR